MIVLLLRAPQYFSRENVSIFFHDSDLFCNRILRVIVETDSHGMVMYDGIMVDVGLFGVQSRHRGNQSYG